MTKQELMQQVLQWPEEDRAELFALLGHSLKPGDMSDEATQAAWIAEAKRRADACDRGEQPWQDWDEFCQEMEAKRS